MFLKQYLHYMNPKISRDMISKPFLVAHISLVLFYVFRVFCDIETGSPHPQILGEEPHLRNFGGFYILCMQVYVTFQQVCLTNRMLTSLDYTVLFFCHYYFILQFYTYSFYLRNTIRMKILCKIKLCASHRQIIDHELCFMCKVRYRMILLILLRFLVFTSLD